MTGWGWVAAGYLLTGGAWAGYAWWVARSLKDAS